MFTPFPFFSPFFFFALLRLLLLLLMQQNPAPRARVERMCERIRYDDDDCDDDDNCDDDDDCDDDNDDDNADDDEDDDDVDVRACACVSMGSGVVKATFKKPTYIL